MNVVFGPWAPDARHLDHSVLTICRNALVGGDGPNFFYKPMPSLSSYSSNALDGPCVGFFVFRNHLGNDVTFACTANKIFKFNTTTLAWEDVSQAGGYTADPDSFWWGEEYNDYAVLGCGGVKPQRIDFNVGTVFEDVPGNPPVARWAGQVGPHFVLAGLETEPHRIQWCAAGNIENWEIGGGPNRGDEQLFNDGGWVTGIIEGRLSGFVMQSDKIRRMTYSRDSRHFQFEPVSRSIGMTAPWSLASTGEMNYFLGRNGFYSFDGQTVLPIGRGKIDRFFLDNTSGANVYQTRGQLDPTDTKIIWAYRRGGTGASSYFNTLLIYDYLRQWWTEAWVDVAYIGSAVPVGVDLDSLSTVFPQYNLDTLPWSLDSKILQGGFPSLAAFGTDDRLQFFAGEPLAATFATGDFQMNGMRRSIVLNSAPEIEGAENPTMAIGYRERLKDKVIWGPERPLEVTGHCNQMVSGRYVRARTQLPADDNWKKAYGCELEIGDDGFR